MKGMFKSLAALLVVAPIALVGCGDPEEALRQKNLDEHQAAWAEVQSAKEALEGKRAELADAVARVKAADDEEAADAEGATAPTAEEIESMENNLAAQSENFTRQLVDFINRGVDLELEESEIQTAAIRLKSDEDIVLAQEFIQKGGDYKQAIQIYENALKFDPSYERLNELMSAAQSDRFMTQERFDLAKKGMTQDEVKELLGPVLHYNQQIYEERGVIAWFYPKGEDKSAAGVFFREQRGTYKVYELKFDAVDPQAADE